MACEFDGSTQYLSGSSTLLGNEPIDMVAHVLSDSAANFQAAVGLGDSGANNGQFSLNLDGNVAGDPVSARKDNDGGSGDVASATSSGYATGTWHVAAAAHISDASRASFLDGGSKGTNATSRTDPTPNFISIGALRRSAVTRYFDGKIAEAYLLDMNMTDGQHAARGKGYSPLWDVPIKNVRGWFPLLRDPNNRMAGGYPNLSPTNAPTYVAHPPKVVHPRFGGLITI